MTSYLFVHNKSFSGLAIGDLGRCEKKKREKQQQQQEKTSSTTECFGISVLARLVDWYVCVFPCICMRCFERICCECFGD